MDSFLSDFNTTAIRSILKIYADRFLQTDPFLDFLLDEYTSKKATFAQPRVYKNWFKNNIDQNHN